jgi:hypothetical protein
LQGQAVACPRCRGLTEVPQLGVVAGLPPPAPARAQPAADDDEPVEARPRVRRQKQVANEYDNYDDEPITKRRTRRNRRGRHERVDTKGLDKVNLGLGCHYARMVLVLFSAAGMILGMIGAFFGAASALGQAGAGNTEGAGGNAGLAIALILLVIVGVTIRFIVPLLGLVGSILCMWVPARSGAKGLIIASLVLDVISIPLSILLNLLSVLPGSVAVAAALGTIPAFVLAFVAWALFMLFLRQLCNYLDEVPMGDEAMAILMRGILIMFVTPIVLFALFILIGIVPCLGAFPAGFIFFYSLYYFFVFLRRQLDLIGSLRQVIYSKF